VHVLCDFKRHGLGKKAATPKFAVMTPWHSDSSFRAASRNFLVGIATASPCGSSASFVCINEVNDRCD
jgi:hypothetical protein